jgi:hypothetical protein
MFSSYWLLNSFSWFIIVALKKKKLKRVIKTVSHRCGASVAQVSPSAKTDKIDCTKFGVGIFKDFRLAEVIFGLPH